MSSSRRTFLTIVACLACAAPVVAEEPTARRLTSNGLRIELAPLPADQVRAFFLGRGFSSEHADHIAATACVFRSAIGSAFTIAGEPDVRVSLRDWTVTSRDGATSGLRTREDWDATWRVRSVGEEAATAFYWSLFPTEQTMASTDYNWGFLTFALAPRATFDLGLVWYTDGTRHTARLEALQCGE